MKTIGTITETIEMVLRKERRGSLKKSQIQTAVRIGINNFFDKLIIIYGASREIPAALRPFIKTTTVSITDSVGSVPSDFSKEITFYVPNVNSNPADFLDPAQFEERKNSVLKPATEIDPIGRLELSTIIVRPQNISEIKLVYFKRPTDVVIATTVSGDGRDLIYNDAGSTDTEFAPEYAPDIIKEALMFLGVPQQDEGAISLSETTKI